MTAPCRYALPLVGFALAALFAGCTDPKFKTSQERRDQRISGYGKDIAAREKKGPQNIQDLAHLEKTLEAHRAAHLKSMEALYKELRTREARRWQPGDPGQKAVYDALWGGKPERIPDTFARVAY